MKLQHHRPENFFAHHQSPTEPKALATQAYLPEFATSGYTTPANPPNPHETLPSCPNSTPICSCRVFGRPREAPEERCDDGNAVAGTQRDARDARDARDTECDGDGEVEDEDEGGREREKKEREKVRERERERKEGRRGRRSEKRKRRAGVLGVPKGLACFRNASAGRAERHRRRSSRSGPSPGRRGGERDGACLRVGKILSRESGIPNLASPEFSSVRHDELKLFSQTRV